MRRPLINKLGLSKSIFERTESFALFRMSAPAPSVPAKTPNPHGMHSSPSTLSRCCIPNNSARTFDVRPSNDAIEHHVGGEEIFSRTSIHHGCRTRPYCKSGHGTKKGTHEQCVQAPIPISEVAHPQVLVPSMSAMKSAPAAKAVAQSPSIRRDEYIVGRCLKASTSRLRNEHTTCHLPREAEVEIGQVALRVGSKDAISVPIPEAAMSRNDRPPIPEPDLCGEGLEALVPPMPVPLRTIPIAGPSPFLEPTVTAGI